jgi:hypothetical protein
MPWRWLVHLAALRFMTGKVTKKAAKAHATEAKDESKDRSLPPHLSTWHCESGSFPPRPDKHDKLITCPGFVQLTRRRISPSRLTQSPSPPPTHSLSPSLTIQPPVKRKSCCLTAAWSGSSKESPFFSIF